MNTYLNILLFVALATLVSGTCVPMSFDQNPVQGNSKATVRNSVDDVSERPCNMGNQEIQLKTDKGFHFNFEIDFAHNLLPNHAHISIFDGPKATGTRLCVIDDDDGDVKCPKSSSTNEITLSYIINNPIYSFLPQFSITAKSTKSSK
uniref:Phosphatidylglycerol/phosphatidylinositol transfer protein n=1 Tax=Rhabditophanes sp. KR3021 TaxID=114890 RepID=A0AC35TVX5_9BILA